jgi:putative two-component system response regulator
MGEHIYKVLVIDDDPEIREIIRQTLTKLGYKAGTAKSGEEGIERITRESFSLVLCDVMMPEMDGLETLSRIKKLDNALPVVMISGEGTHDRLIQAINKGATDFISKPLNFIQMNLIIKKTLAPDSVTLPETSSPVAHLMRDGYLTLLNMVNTMLELKNTYMKNHANKVAQYSRKIATAMKLPDEQIEVIYYASVLHDIGKIGVNDTILLKPDKLNERE